MIQDLKHFYRSQCHISLLYLLQYIAIQATLYFYSSLFSYITLHLALILFLNVLCIILLLLPIILQFCSCWAVCYNTVVLQGLVHYSDSD